MKLNKTQLERLRHIFDYDKDECIDEATCYDDDFFVIRMYSYITKSCFTQALRIGKKEAKYVMKGIMDYEI